MSTNIHVGDVGTAFRFTVKDEDGNIVTLQGASTLQARFRRPDGSTFDRTGHLAGDGSDGKFFYATVTGDLDQAGTWQVQGYVVTAAWGGHTGKTKFKVEANL